MPHHCLRSILTVAMWCVALLPQTAEAVEPEAKPAAEPAISPERVLLFDSGADGYPRYRIPALMVAGDGALLAFCEGRKDGRGLTGNIDLVVRRSSDSGRTWGELEVVADGGPHTLGNPCPVLDRTTGTIWLLLTRSHGSDLEREIVAGTSRERTRVLLTSSTDHGRTWSPLRKVPGKVRRPEWTWYGTGPGTGLQLASGRLLVPAYHVHQEDRIYRSHALYSDDHGKTWTAGEPVGDHTSEAQVTQRADGTVVLNTRTVQGKELRTVAESTDGGATWGRARFEPQLYDPHCQACVFSVPLREKAARPLWLYSGPAGPGRRNMTVRTSRDEGRTWGAGKLLQEGDSQYSSLALLPNGQVGCLYESWQRDNYRLFFARFPPGWLGIAERVQPSAVSTD